MNLFASNEPRREATRPEPSIGSPALAESARKGKTLLVVEDEAGVRELETQILESCGFRVLQAGCVAEALQVAAAAAPLHLLLTDFSLPDGTGFDVARQFRVLHPQAAMILVSGSVAGLAVNSEDLKHLVVMGKPFEISELLHTVQALLTDTPPPG
jgi:two-component system, cell cycle sensor histidine kinase and response regulator CckA